MATRRDPPSTPTPAEREARIAALRARRRSRLRTLAIRGAIGTGVLVLLGAAALYWLLMTLGGRDFLLAQVAARLPAGATLTWRTAQGPVAGPMTLTGVHFDHDGIVFDARRVVLDPDIRPMFGRLLRLDALQVADARLQLPKNDTPFELPRWPEVLPRIEPPLGLQADAIRVDRFRIERGGEALIAIRSLRGGLDARTGRLSLDHVVVDSDRGVFKADGDYAPRQDFRTHLVASALLPAPRGRTRPRLGLSAQGTLSDMDVALAGRAPGPVQARLSLHGDAAAPAWTFGLDARRLDIGLLASGRPDGLPLSAHLQAHGTGGTARVQGRVDRGDLKATLRPSTLRLEDQVLQLDPLSVDVFGGHVLARGRGDFADPAHAAFRFAVAARGLAFGADPATRIGVDADLGLAGSARAWATTGKATIRRDALSAELSLDGRGHDGGLAIRRLHASMPTGTLDATGDVAWSPRLRWTADATLAGFDPGYFLAAWPGAVTGQLSSTGHRRDDGGLEATLDAGELGGQLRGRPLGGQARLALHGAKDAEGVDTYEGTVALRIGDSRVDAEGAIGEALDVHARFSPLRLSDAWPGASGRVQGTLDASGRRDAPSLVADLRGDGLRYQGYRAERLRLDGRLPWQGRSGTLTLDAGGVQAGVALDTVHAVAHGALSDLQLDAQARGDIGALSLSGHAERRGGDWQGTLASLRLAPTTGAAWTLRNPTRFAQRGAGWTLSRACVASGGGGSLCAEADWPRQGVTLRSEALPLALLQPYLPKQPGDRAWILRGDVTLDASLRPAGDAYAGHATLRSPEGGVRTRKRAQRDLVGYRDLRLDANFDAQRIHAELAGTLTGTASDGATGTGAVSARVDTGWDAGAPLDGQLTLDTNALTWMELLSPDILDPKGELHARLAVAGTRDAPSLGGQARLSGFSTEIPSLGIVLDKGRLTLDAQPDGSAKLAGQVDSGEGTLHVDGTLDWRDLTSASDTATPLVLQVRGTDVLVADTRDLHALASPDVTVRYAAGEPLSVEGKVGVPSALLDLERLDQGVKPSDDVVVLDPANPEDAGPPTPLDLDVTLALGDDVRLDGFGLDGTLDGTLRVRAEPGRPMRATGVLEVGGRYSAYGQKLSITRGHLQWNNSPVDDPLLDIRAERRIEARDLSAGISVTGRATAPQADVWTDPATSQSDALSYLALGRPTTSLSSTEGRQLNAASAALSAGGNLLASQLGSRIGLDDAGIVDSRTLGGSVLGFGKRLSPRLYVGFGVSLLGTGQVLTLKYLLAKGFDLQVESSTVETRGSINWRKEK